MKDYYKYGKVIAVFLCSISAFLSQGQIVRMPDDSNYLQVRALYDSVLSYQNFDSSESSFSNQMKKWENYWNSRLMTTGNFNVAARAMNEYTSGYSNNLDPALVTWECLGPFKDANSVLSQEQKNNMGRLHAIAFLPEISNDQTIFVGSAYSGVFKTEDGGQNWTNYHTDHGLPWTSVTDLQTYSFDNEHYIVAATGDGDEDYGFFSFGIYRNKIGTNMWDPINSGLENELSGIRITQIRIDPDDPDIAYFTSNKGLFKTSNLSSDVPTWLKIYSPPNMDPVWPLKGLVINPDNPDNVYLSGNDVYVTYNSGQTFSSLTDNNPTSVLEFLQSVLLKRLTFALFTSKIVLSFLHM
ncbi:MAG: WD40/YVTN/BNR-like repeat-containing protein [Bacteroidales bacterium]